MRYTLVLTEDGTPSCLDAETGELCHNRAGAYTEALKHYTEPSGLTRRVRETGSIRLLDACFGMGYNTLVLLNEILKDPPDRFSVTVIGVEASKEILSHMPRVLQNGMLDALDSKTGLSEHNIYYRTQPCLPDTKGWGGERAYFVMDVAEGCRIELEILVGDLRQVIPSLGGEFDAVFHDPFSPARMPELWTIDLFREYARLLRKPEGLLMTYSTAAAVRGGLQEAGFRVFKTPALGHKTGGTLAGFQEALGLPLDEREMAYMASRAGIPYYDDAFALTAQQVRDKRQLIQGQSSRPPGNAIRNSGDRSR